eukprot:6176675-Pleurochrysis_carterae.AAC.3
MTQQLFVSCRLPPSTNPPFCQGMHAACSVSLMWSGAGDPGLWLRHICRHLVCRLRPLRGAD